VGLPRESRISRAPTASMVATLTPKFSMTNQPEPSRQTSEQGGLCPRLSHPTAPVRVDLHDRISRDEPGK
jgi:hypothetical protein